MPSKFRTDEDMKKNWFEQAKHIGNQDKRIKTLEAKLKEYDLSIDTGDTDVIKKAEEAVTAKMKPALDYVNQVRMQQVEAEIAEMYPGFDLNENSEKIIAELKWFDDSARNADPTGCLKRAVANILQNDEALSTQVREAAKKKQMAATEAPGGGAPPAPAPQPGEVDPMDELVGLTKEKSRFFQT
jgi:hypothetical protein